MNTVSQGGRLSTLAAAFVIARRDFTAVLFSRSFLFFLLGPLFPLIVGVLAAGVGDRVEESAARPTLGIVMRVADADAMMRAHAALNPQVGEALPDMAILRRLKPGEAADPARALGDNRANVAAVLSGTLAAPVLTGPKGQVEYWRGPVSLLAAQALGRGPQGLPTVALSTTVTSVAKERRAQRRTAQGGQTVLFLLTMLLAGMVLSNLVEEKGNKIIEVLAAAIPMEAVFFGKLFAMLGVSFVGIAVWGAAYGAIAAAGASSLGALPAPAVGWPLFVALGVIYFAMAYLLLGSLFLTIGSMAATVREVQTLSMPVTMLQLLVFFFASFAMAMPGTAVALAAEVIPLSSPFAMLARAAQESALWPHLLALAWQALWVTMFVRFGARLFRSRVMKSGPQGSGKRRWFRQPQRVPSV